MPFITSLSIILAVLFALLLGRTAVISYRRGTQIIRLEAEVKTLSNRLSQLGHSSWYQRRFEIVADELAEAYDVNVKVYVFGPDNGDEPESISRCLVKSFPFDGDRDFARRSAEELLDQLNE